MFIFPQSTKVKENLKLAVSQGLLKQRLFITQQGLESMWKFLCD